MSTNTTPRLLTLDVFRGMTVFLMIVVNTQGGGAMPYSQMMHADWNGFTLTDLVFPSFLFAVGNALAFVIKCDQPKTPQLTKIVRRTFLLFAVGLALSWYSTMHFTTNGIAFVNLAHLRILAVLQRIALCYCIAALAALYMPGTAIWACSIVFLITYWLMLFLGGAPGNPYAETTNLVRTIDLNIIGEAHMYREHGLLFDPEGLLSTLTATVNVMAGYLTGLFIKQKGRTNATVWRLLLAGAALATAGCIWSYWFPLNKKLWTSSFVLLTVGIDLIVISGLFSLLEIRQWRKGINFFTVLGKNPLFVYVFSNLLLIVLIWPVKPGLIWIDYINAAVFQALAPGPLGCLLFALAFAGFCWIIAWWLDRRKIYIRL